MAVLVVVIFLGMGDGLLQGTISILVAEGMNQTRRELMRALTWYFLNPDRADGYVLR